MRTIKEIADGLRTYTNRGELHLYLNMIADELEEHIGIRNENCIDVKDCRTPTESGTYRVILSDGEVYYVSCSCYANGWFWEIPRSVKIHFDVYNLGEPRVIKWYPNPKRQ